MAHKGIKRMAQLIKRSKCDWSWQLSQLSLEMMRQYDERAQLEGDEDWLGHEADFSLQGGGQ